MYPVTITGPAKDDIINNRDWWAANRSEEEANRWYEGIIETMFALESTFAQNPFATEPGLKANQIRQVSFGLGRRPSHRILYAVRDNSVVIYRVRAFKQDKIGLKELQ